MTVDNIIALNKNVLSWFCQERQSQREEVNTQKQKGEKTVARKHLQLRSLTGCWFNEGLSGFDWIRRYCDQRAWLLRTSPGDNPTHSIVALLHPVQYRLKTSVGVELQQGKEFCTEQQPKGENTTRELVLHHFTLLKTLHKLFMQGLRHLQNKSTEHLDCLTKSFSSDLIGFLLVYSVANTVQFNCLTHTGPHQFN